MKQYLPILQQEISSITERDLYIPINETGVDSLGLVVIRVAIEKYFGFEITDTIWYKFQSLGEALNYFHQNKKPQTTPKNKAKNIIISKKQEIRMPQMANSALSENWFLKEMGDIHWLLISDGLEKKSSELKDENGNRLYATFIRINYSITALSSFKENDTVSFYSQIKRFGNSTYLSMTNGNCNEIAFNATLMTNFSIRDNNDNSQITKSDQYSEINHIEPLKNTPDFLNDYRLVKKELLDELKTGYGIFKLYGNPLWNCRYNINPYYDINGVGLLYFASYPIISDKCFLDYLSFSKKGNGFINNYHTVYRDIFYFGNCNPDDEVIFHLNNIEEDYKSIKTVSSLFRQSDNILLAKILNVKQHV